MDTLKVVVEAEIQEQPCDEDDQRNHEEYIHRLGEAVCHLLTTMGHAKMVKYAVYRDSRGRVPIPRHG